VQPAERTGGCAPHTAVTVAREASQSNLDRVVVAQPSQEGEGGQANVRVRHRARALDDGADLFAAVSEIAKTVQSHFVCDAVAGLFERDQRSADLERELAPEPHH